MSQTSQFGFLGRRSGPAWQPGRASFTRERGFGPGPARQASPPAAVTGHAAPGVQARLTVGPPTDRFEQEADRVADQVTRMDAPGPAAGPAKIQRKCPACEEGLQRQVEEEEEEELQANATGGARAGVQAKLTVGAPHDAYEQEADRVADQVMRMGATDTVAGGPAQIQRKCPACEEELQRQAEEEEEEEIQAKPAASGGVGALQRQAEEEEEEEIQAKPAAAGGVGALQRQAEEEEEEEIQARPAGGGARAAPNLEAQVGALEGRGQPLPDAARSFFEPRLNRDLGNVRVHTDAHASGVARNINARAFTYRNHIAFAAGQYAPDTQAGRHLLAHELVHTVQQGATASNLPVQRTVGDGDDLVSDRFSCDPDLEAAYDNERFLRSGSSGPAVRVLQQALVDAGHPLPRFGVDGQFGSETRSAVIAYQRASGLTGGDVDGIVGHQTMDLLDIDFLFDAPTPAPSCSRPGNQRTVSVQPVFFRDSATDPTPTGTSWAARFVQSNAVWNKLGVLFSSRSPVTITDAANKTAGANLAEFNRIRALRQSGGIEVFMVDNEMAFLGGGGTILGGSSNAQIVMSDRGTSNTLLAHELGHVLGLGHPPAGADTNTIMTPSGSHSAANPTRNTMCNYARITFPRRGPETCLLPDP